MNTKTDISAAYVGSTGVDKLCLGNEVVWESTPPGPVPYEEQYLTIHALDQASLRSNTAYTGGSVYYRTKGSSNWQTLSPGTTISMSADDAIELKGQSGATALFSGGTQSGHYEVYGNVMSLIHGDNFVDQTTIPSGLVDCFYSTFRECQSLVSIKNMVMPATTLSQGCYRSMFNKCRYLSELPDVFIPSGATLSSGCCRYTFEELGASASTHVNVSAGFLPSTNLNVRCYESMFNNANISSAPELPATTLAERCYISMFRGCTSLTTAPVLPAETMDRNWSSCYQSMFQGCTSLSTITCLLTYGGQATAYNYYTNGWVSNVAATGTFYKAPSATGWTTGVSGIPSGWTVQNYDSNPVVLKIAGQSIQPKYAMDGDYSWEDLDQYSGTSFTIEVGGVPITADTWDYDEEYIDECGTESQLTYETGTTRSTFQVYSGYIRLVSYYSSDNSVGYISYDDHTSDDPQTICECQGNCWDVENQECHECPPEDPCDDYEGAGYSSYEECTCAERGENCPEEESGE